MPLERRRQQEMECVICGHEWKADFPVFPEAPDRLECPNCGYMNDWGADPPQPA